MSELINVRLSKAQLQWLSDRKLLPTHLMSYLWSAASGGALDCQMPLDIAESICDALTNVLGEIGFDDDEGLTADGVTLETLIDQFTQF